MSGNLPAPLVPAEVDLGGYEFMPYYGDKLRESGLNARATDAEYRAAHNLWWSAWKQVPASSLPNDDIDLCKAADLGRDLKAWKEVRTVALRKFVLCNDGRLYHEVLAILALDAWATRLAARGKGINGASKRWAKHRHEKQIAQASKNDGTGNAPATKNDSKGEERVPPLAPLPKKRTRQRLPATSAPDSFEVTEELAEWAVSQGLPEDQHERQTMKMLNHYKGKGEMRSDWVATWRNWVLKAVEFGQGKAA